MVGQRRGRLGARAMRGKPPSGRVPGRLPQGATCSGRRAVGEKAVGMDMLICGVAVIQYGDFTMPR